MKVFKNYGKYRKRYSNLVELERKEEMERHENEIKHLSGGERQRRGRALLGLKGKDEGKALGNKYIIKFVKGKELPENEISVGDLVMISKNNPLRDDNPTGTVIGKTNYSLSVAFQNKPKGFVYGKGIRVDLYVNDITFQRMLDALDHFKKPKNDQRHLKKLILGKEDPRFREVKEVNIKNEDLNKSQIKAVKKSLEAEDIFLIHGPPGTGKTTTLIEVIEQHIDSSNKVLATAASNVAVDNMVEFLTKRGRKAVRIGHPARITETLREHSLDHLASKKSKYNRAQELREKATSLDDEQDKYTFPSGRHRRGLGNNAIKNLARKNKGSRGIHPKKIKSMAKWIKLQEEIGKLIEKAKKLEDEVVDEIIEGADVVCATNSTSGSELLSDREFDVAVIDEATQATEPSCLIPMTHSSKVIMAGDHKQLPPTILNQKAEEEGLKETLFERMVDIYGDKMKEMLTIQYRMNVEIMGFSNRKFYDRELKAAKSVATHQLNSEIENKNNLIKKVCNPNQVVTFLDTSGEYRERSRKNSTSKENKGEANLVRKIVNQLLDLGLHPREIGVISPYDDQTDLLSRKINTKGVEIKTVDGFQGREKEVIVVSFVRSNDMRNIGFLKELRRLNVSLTRARKKLILVGDRRTLSYHKPYRDLIDYIKKKGGLIKL